MASSLKNLSTYDESNMPSAEKMKIGIVVADWNAKITHALYEGCYDTLLKHEAKEENIITVQVPGTFELPGGAKLMMQNEKYNAVICIGCVIKGETSHNEYINHSVAHGLVSRSCSNCNQNGIYKRGVKKEREKKYWFLTQPFFEEVPF